MFPEADWPAAGSAHSESKSNARRGLSKLRNEPSYVAGPGKTDELSSLTSEQPEFLVWRKKAMKYVLSPLAFNVLANRLAGFGPSVKKMYKIAEEIFAAMT